MEGGAETGFRHVEPEKYKTRLLQVFGKGKNLQIREVIVSVLYKKDNSQGILFCLFEFMSVFFTIFTSATKLFIRFYLLLGCLSPQSQHLKKSLILST